MPAHRSKTDIQTERRIPIICTSDTTDGEGNALIQASIACTRVNGRLYRQCRTYKVRLSLIVAPTHDAGTQTSYEFFSLPNNYFVHGAIKHASDTYWQMMQEELAQGIKPARWHDFMINEQNPTGVWEYTHPALTDGTADGGWAVPAADEFITDSSVTDAGGTSQGFHILGNLANSYNIFREYSKKLNYRPEPGQSSSDQPYDGLLDLDDSDVLAERGDEAPYDRDWSSFIPDDTTVDDDAGQQLLLHRGSISFDSNGAVGGLSTGFFEAPLGLVWVRKYAGGSEAAFSTTIPELALEFARGDYKGVYSHSLV